MSYDRNTPQNPQTREHTLQAKTQQQNSLPTQHPGEFQLPLQTQARTPLRHTPLNPERLLLTNMELVWIYTETEENLSPCLSFLGSSMAKRCRGTALAFSFRKRQLNPRGWNSSSPHTSKAKALGNKKGKKYISFYGPYTTWPLLSAQPWVARLGDDTGVAAVPAYTPLISRKQMRGNKSSEANTQSLA